MLQNMHFGGQGQRTEIGGTEIETKTVTETGTGTKTTKCYRINVAFSESSGRKRANIEPHK